MEKKIRNKFISADINIPGWFVTALGFMSIFGLIFGWIGKQFGCPNLGIFAGVIIAFALCLFLNRRKPTAKPSWKWSGI